MMRGDIESAFRQFREQYDTGADPIVVLSDLAEFVNFVTRVKIVPATAETSLRRAERVRARTSPRRRRCGCRRGRGRCC